MHRVEFHKRARKALKRIPKERASQILAAIDRLAELPNPASHPNVRLMHGEWSGFSRMRVGSYRVIFRVREQESAAEVKIIAVTHIGARGDVYS